MSDAGTWQRWEMGAVGARAGRDREPAPQAADELPPALAERLAALGAATRQAAHEEGHAHGYEAGHRLGLEEGRRAGYEAGHAAGLQAGREAALEEGRAIHARQAAQLEQLLDQCGQSLAQLGQDTGQALVSLALDIARQVAGAAVRADTGLLLETVRSILDLHSGQDTLLRLRLHPDALDLVQAHFAGHPDTRHWRLQPDTSLEPGDCIAETPLGRIDATLQTRWQRVAAALASDTPWTPAS